MLRATLYLHWQQIRLGLVPFVLAAFGLPLLAVQGLGNLGAVADAEGASVAAYVALDTFRSWRPLFPSLAAAIGGALALSAWNWDHRLEHVYALSLPLARWRYALLKLAAGALLALPPAAAFWAGCHLAAGALSLPEGLRAYPGALALRFLGAALLVYSVLFALAAGTVRTTVVVVSVVLVLLTAIETFDAFVAHSLGFYGEVDVVGWIGELLGRPGGPLRVFLGSWSLIDV